VIAREGHSVVTRTYCGQDSASFTVSSKPGDVKEIGSYQESYSWRDSSGKVACNVIIEWLALLLRVVVVSA
jgi:hypothetical protein